MKKDLGLFINDILESIKRIEEFTKNTSKEKFEKDIKLQDAIMRRIEIIGEAVKNIPLQFKEKYSNISWNKITGMKDILTPSYFKVDLDSVWNVIRKDLNRLKKQIEEVEKNLRNKKY